MSAQGMPPHLLALFAPRPPMEHLPPVGGEGRRPNFNGIQSYIDLFETTPPPPKSEKAETPQERKARLARAALRQHKKEQEELIKAYDATKQECVCEEPYKTLFVARLSYETTEKRLQKEFEKFGAIRHLTIITDKQGRSRGYAFIEYESELDMRLAYKRGDGLKIDGRRVLVDVERSRTVENWLPRRLGGGKGKPRGQRQPQLPPLPQQHMLGGPHGPSLNYHQQQQHSSSHSHHHHQSAQYNQRPNFHHHGGGYGGGGGGRFPQQQYHRRQQNQQQQHYGGQPPHLYR